MERKIIIKRIWTIAHALYGRDKERYIYGMINFVFDKERFRELSDEQLYEVWRILINELSMNECPQAPQEWRLIKVLQRQAGWSDEHLKNYLKHYAHISSPRFMTQHEAKIVISAMKKIIKRGVNEALQSR
jgi:hypothetical protein